MTVILNDKLQKLKKQFVLSADPSAAVEFANAVIQAETRPDAPATKQENSLHENVRMAIPTVGSELVLAEDWTFDLHREHRNYTFWNKIHPNTPMDNRYSRYGETSTSISTTLPAGSVLKVARIYIRQGVSSYDSLTFTLVKHPDIKKIKGRFWAKLQDVNKMVVNWKTDTLKGV